MKYNGWEILFYFFKCPISLATREMLIITTLKFHLTEVKMAKLIKTNDYKC